MRPFLTPAWLGRHLLLVLSLVVLTTIGWWQWDKARGQGDWQNYGYAIQWWLFAGFAVFLWLKLILDERDPGRVEQRNADRVPVLPAAVAAGSGDGAVGKGALPVQRAAPAAAADEVDEELAAYNRHLAWLHENADR